jgi:hypothetical protein
MNKICCIYTITNILNNKIYVGYTANFKLSSKPASLSAIFNLLGQK